MCVMRSERSTRVRLAITLVAWVLLSLLLTGVIGTAPDRMLFVSVVIGWALIAAVATRLHHLLEAAERGAVRFDESGRRYRAAFLLPGALVVGTVASAPAAALATTQALTIAVRAGSTSAAALVAVLLVRFMFRRDPERAFTSRNDTLFSWLVVDGALLAALLSSPFGALVLAARLSAGAETTPPALARHFASSIVLYAALLGVAGFMKVRRERRSGLVVSPASGFSAPSALAVGGTLAVITLFVIPLLPMRLDASELIVVKGVVGALSALLFFSLGGLRAAGGEAV
jgi:hypothetical protein